MSVLTAVTHNVLLPRLGGGDYWFRDFERESIKRGMIRYLYLAIDLSKAMSEGDMRPSRLAVTLRMVQDFIANYFDQNPLSQLGVLVTR